MAKTRKHEKNLAKVQSMIDGTYDSEFGKIKVGQYSPTEKTRKVGDKWTDSDGVEWEQKEGFKVKGKMRRHYSWDQNCKDCGKNCGSTKGEVNRRNNATFLRMDRCYYCQIDFEAELKGVGKFDEWKEKQDKRIKEKYIDEFEKENKEFIKELEKMRKSDNPFDTKVANAMANENVSMAIKNNKS